jgi:hypothetical protein
VLGKLKAELRAHVYAVLEKGESRTPSPLRDFLTTTSGRLVASLVRYTYVFACPFLLLMQICVQDPELFKITDQNPNPLNYIIVDKK